MTQTGLHNGLPTRHDSTMKLADRPRRSAPARPGRIGWVLAACSVATIVVLLATPTLRHAAAKSDPTNVYPVIVFSLSFPIVGAIILSRLGNNALGWLYLLAGGLAGTLTLGAYAYAQVGLVERPGSLPGAVAAGWISSWIWACSFMPLMTYGLLLFPDGHVPSPRWRLVGWVCALPIALQVFANAFAPGALTNQPVRDNPLGLPLPRGFMTALGNVGFVVFVGCLGASLASLAFRWRRARGVERAQVQWLLAAAAVLLVLVVSPHKSTSVVDDAMILVVVLVVPLSIAFAILRHHLFGVNLVVRRSLVYGLLTSVLLAVYVTTVGLLSGVVHGRTADPAAAAVVAVLFSPLRAWLQGGVDRMLYGERGDPYAVLTRLARQGEAATDPMTVLAAATETIGSALRLPYVSITLPADEPGRPTAIFGTAVEALHEVRLVCEGTDVGLLVVGQRSGTRGFGRAELALLDDLGRQVALTARSALLFHDLLRSRERLVTAREEERRRIRRDLHDGLGPALAGIAFGLDASRNLLRTDPSASDEMLRQLKVETLRSVGEIRRIAHDLRPPALDELGLVKAVEEYAMRVSSGHPPLTVVVGSIPALPALPAAVEVAAYRIAVEAITNASRHSGGSRCIVSFDVESKRPTALRLVVEDNGHGIGPQMTMGVGLTAMNERVAELGGRIDIANGCEGGARMVALFPLAAGI